MTNTFWKATRPDGTDFHTGKIGYADALNTGTSVAPPSAQKGKFALSVAGVLHAATAPDGTLFGGEWPCRLFEVTGEVVVSQGTKVGMVAMTPLREVEAWRALGPQGKECGALIERADSLTADEIQRLATVWEAARHGRAAALGAALGAARDAGRDAAYGATYRAARAAGRGASRDDARDAVWDVARFARAAAADAAVALMMRDLIGQYRFTQEHYDQLTQAWRSVIGPLHPDDE